MDHHKRPRRRPERVLPGPTSAQIGGRRVPRGLLGPWRAPRRGGTGAVLWGDDCGAFSWP
eukprot:CAMPEP_0185689028 /NCGR_PEP_ID=MMETSP1164-20130828/208_1 /TAXON_ID=1104430 /ORGANISM="Chrysoreinhardia sp, Strain CCMP2950" /LENGTH=59 /DNA_ID=CAMNT_0028355505 /DNA_START=1 /DNA_END=177 /DNA_ORIENTATION=+